MSATSDDGPAHRPGHPGAPRADLPSFTRGLFLGDIRHEFLFPYPDPLDMRDPDEAVVVQRLIADLRRLERDLIDSARFDEEEAIPEEVLGACAEIGMCGLTIPKEFGGLGLSTTGYGRVFSTLSAIDPSLAVVFGVHCGLGSKTIVLFGSPEQQARYLPPLAKGAMFAAYALTEPYIGSDAQHIEARAFRAPSGDGWRKENLDRTGTQGRRHRDVRADGGRTRREARDASHGVSRPPRHARLSRGRRVQQAGYPREKRRSLFEAQDAVDRQRDELIGKIEAKLAQSTNLERLFAVRSIR